MSLIDNLDTIQTKLSESRESLASSLNEKLGTEINGTDTLNTMINSVDKIKLVQYSEYSSKVFALQSQIDVIMNQLSDNFVAIEGQEMPSTIDDATKSVIAVDKVFNTSKPEGAPEGRKVAGINNITAKDIVFDNISTSDDENADYQVIRLNAENITFTNSEMNVEGKITNYNPSTNKLTYINTQLSINKASNIVINGLKYNANQGYNGMELGLSDTEPKIKTVTIENFNIDGEMTHNIFNIFSFADNAIVNINNCHFTNAWGVLRISNKFNNKGLVVNLTNVTVDNTTCDSTKYNPGLIILQDYINPDLATMQSENPFGGDKVTINLTNVSYMGEKITSDMNIGAPVPLAEGQTVKEKLTIASVYGPKTGGSYIDKNKYPELYPIINVY